MKKEEIHLWDIKRILFGQAPPEFLLEVFIRSLVVYIATIMVMRWLGKRMNGQLTILELSVMVTMGAIISVPMQIPDRGILQGLLVLLCTLVFLRGVNWLGFKSTKFEKLVQGEVSTLVKNGIIEMKELERTRITNQQLFEILRSKKIFNLGKVKRLYLEACGVFSVYPEEKPKPGLPLFPHKDPAILEMHIHKDIDYMACNNCGLVKPGNGEEAQCSNCGNKEWTKAIL